MARKMTEQEMSDKLAQMCNREYVYGYQSAAFNRLFVKYAKIAFPGRKPRYAFEDWVVGLK